VNFHSKAVREFVEELAENGLAHVRFYRKTLGGSAARKGSSSGSPLLNELPVWGAASSNGNGEDGR
jgi:hypothetical protein